MVLRIGSALSLILIPSAAAQVVYDNFGAGDTYAASTGWVVSDDQPFGNAVDQAMSFNPSAAGPLGEIEFAMNMVGGPGQASFDVELYSDGGGEPGVSLDLASYSGMIEVSGQSPVPPPLALQFSGGALLDPSQTYWIVISLTAPITPQFLIWNNNVVGDTGTTADRRNGLPAWNVFPNQNLATFRVHLAGDIGAPYCVPAVVNSTGSSGVLQVLGSPSVAANSVTLRASSLPSNQFGFFLNSQSQGFVPGPGGSQGNLCLGGAIGRYNAIIFNSGASGTGSLVLDLGQTPTPSGPVAIAAGQTWNFQCWHRDLNPGATSNFTGAVQVTFTQ